jgi:hypothetical protein
VKKTKAPAAPIDELMEEMEKDAGLGVSMRLRDRTYWLGDIGFDDERWLEACDALDTKQNKEPLLALLRESKALRDHWIADILSRYRLVRKPGRQRTPAYNLTEVNIDLDLALKDVRAQREKRVRLNEAIKSAAREYRLDDEVVRQAWVGKLGSWRRAQAKK